MIYILAANKKGTDRMIDFILKIPKTRDDLKNSIRNQIEIIKRQDRFGGNSKIQLFFPNNTVYRKIDLEENQYIIIGDLVIPKGKSMVDLLDEKIKNNIKYLNGFYYLLEITRDSINIITGIFNILPLFYFADDRYVVISSKAYLFKDNFNFNLTLNKRFILEQKLFNYSFLNETIYKEIKTVPANSYIGFKNGNLSIIKHTYIEDCFTIKPIPWKDSMDKMTDLFLERVKNYFPGEKFFISFTGGFDGRTLVACAKKNDNDFKTYSFGASDNVDLVIPLKQSKIIGLDSESVYLDDDYTNNIFLNNGKELIELTDCNSNFLQVHFLYAAKCLSKYKKYILNGMFGSELFRAMHISGQVTSKALVDFFRYENEREWIKRIKNSDTLKYLNMFTLQSELEELIDDLIEYKRGLNKYLSKNHHFYKFIFEETFRKFFGTQIISQLPYVNVRSPFLDFKFMENLLRTGLAGANNDFFTHNPLKRFKGQLFYAKIIDKSYKPLLYLRTDKGYRPIDLLTPLGKLEIARVYFIKRIKRRFSPPELDNLGIVSGINHNLEFFKSIKIYEELFNKKLVNNLFKSQQWLKDRDKFIETISTNYFIKKTFN